MKVCDGISHGKYRFESVEPDLPMSCGGNIKIYLFFPEMFPAPLRLRPAEPAAAAPY